MLSAKNKLFSFVLKCDFNATSGPASPARYSDGTQTRLKLATETTFCCEHRLSIIGWNDTVLLQTFGHFQWCFAKNNIKFSLNFNEPFNCVHASNNLDCQTRKERLYHFHLMCDCICDCLFIWKKIESGFIRWISVSGDVNTPWRPVRFKCH